MGVLSSQPNTLDVSVIGYSSPDGRAIAVTSNMGILFSDDFGGVALDTAIRWDVFDGGLGANPTLHGKSATQAAIGSGVAMGNGVNGGANSALTVASSALTVAMGTTNGAELWILSQQTFAGSEDLTILLSKSQALTANSIFIGLVEVNPNTLIPILNPNQAGWFTNMGGVEFGATTGLTSYACVAIADSSPNTATGSTAVAIGNLTSTQEFLVEFHAEDIIASNGAVDSIAGKSSLPSRVSTQTPNDGKVYKLLMRFRNVATPASSTTVALQRILLVDSQEMRVEVTSGRGDSNIQKAVAVNLSGNAVATRTTGGVATFSRLSAATAATGYVKGAPGQVYSYDLINTQASIRYLHLYNQATAPTLGTSVPILTIPLAASSKTSLSIDAGWAFSTGIAYGVTTDDAATPATTASAGDVQGTVGYA
jgi:hypothetical protein